MKDAMATKNSLICAAKAKWSRIQFYTKLLLMLGIMMVLVGNLVWEEENCGAARVAVRFEIPLEIFEKVSIADAEQRQMVTVSIEGQEITRPFGFINDKWEELKQQYRNGDCIFHYRDYCGTLCGSEGYVLIRDGEEISFIQMWVS